LHECAHRGSLRHQSEKDYSEATALQIDETARRIVDDAFEQTEKIIRGQQGDLDRAAQALVKQETMNESELRDYFDQRSA